METDLSNVTFDDLLDSAILSHGFMPYMRDYFFLIETRWGGNFSGQYQLLFKYCYELSYKVIPDKDFIKESWDDLFTNFNEWEKANSPDGFVWGTNWSLAYPGFSLVEDSALAQKWSADLGKEMKEMEVETNAYKFNFIFHEWTLKKLNDNSDLINKVIIPLGGIN